MKLWIISQIPNSRYDYYDTAIVAAETEIEAKMIDPSTGENICSSSCEYWVSDPKHVKCEYIGEAKEGTRKGVIRAFGFFP